MEERWRKLAVTTVPKLHRHDYTYRQVNVGKEKSLGKNHLDTLC